MVGDSAMGVSYYRSLNNGFACANELALVIEENDPFKYETFVKSLFKKEARNVRYKKYAMSVFKMWLLYAKFHPLQLIKLNQSEKSFINQTH